MQPLDDRTAIVTGAGRGFGRAIASDLTAAGAHVVGVARTGAEVSADVADPSTAVRLIDEHHPDLLVLCAGAQPRMAPLQEHTWESFSQNWNVDVAQAFHWIGHALRRPLSPGSTVIVFSSGAALKGSPLSGGYAGAKATVRTVAAYAQTESQRAGLGIRFVSVLPRLTPATELGKAAVAAYAERAGVDVNLFVNGLQPELTVEQVAAGVRALATGAEHGHGDGEEAYLLSAAGLSPL